MQKFIAASFLSAALLVSVSTVRAQYSTNFNTGYTATYLTDGQTTVGGTGQNGWLTNDPENDNAGSGTEFVGGSNYVGPDNVGTYANFSGRAASLGGNIRTQAGYIVVPGAATSTVYHPFTVAPPTGQGYQFDTDFVLNVAAGRTALTDRFAFTLANGNTPLITISFAPSGTANAANIGYSLGSASTTTTANQANLNASYHLNIRINAINSTYTATYSLGGVATTIASGSLAGQIAPNSVTRAAAVWTLANGTPDGVGGYSGASTDAILFDNYAVTYFTPVPEPAAYTVLGFGLLALVGMRKFRRLA